jgi:hypothetical protein
MTKIFLMFLLLTSSWLMPHEAHAGWISKAAKVGKIAKKAANAATDTTGKIIGPPIKFALDPNGFIILNSSTKHIRTARDELRKQTECERKVKLKSNSNVFEKPDVSSEIRLVFLQGEAICVKSEFRDWVETPFGWVSVK